MISDLARMARTFPRSGIWLAAALALTGTSAAAADIQRGRTLYSTHCAVCHGADGTPVLPGTPNFRRMDTLMRPDFQVAAAIRNGKGAMPGYFGILRDQEILDVLAFIRTLN